MLSPSIDDIGPTTVQEAFFYELPVIGFDIGFISDFIFSGINGSKIECFSIKKFADTILEFINSENFKNISYNKNVNALREKCYFDTEAISFLNAIKKS